MVDTWLNMDLWVILSFAGAGILLNLTPGADVAFATACGIRNGWVYGVATAFGISLGSLLHITFAAIGISAVVMLIPHAYDIIRLMGAAYLLWLAWRSWNAVTAEIKGQQQPSLKATVLQGFVTNALNPKVALFILAFLPQFTDPTVGPLWHQFLFLGGVFTVTGLIITSAYGAMAGLLRTQLQNTGRFLNRLSALIFGGLAARLIVN